MSDSHDILSTLPTSVDPDAAPGRPGRAGGEKRGNAADRRRSRANLLAWHGDGTVCNCVYCGTTLRENPGAPDHIERDRIMPGEAYRMTNLVPACRGCNNARQDTDIVTYAIAVGALDRVLSAVDRAADYRPRR